MSQTLPLVEGFLKKWRGKMITTLDCAAYFVNDTPWQKLPTDKYDTQFYIEKKEDGEVVIVFKESDSGVDWKNNFHFWKVAYRDADIPFTAHSGFLRCWKEVRHYIEDKVKELNPSSITVTGWSYGGAISVLCLEDMVYCFPDVPSRMVTFGAPRVLGWRNWRKIKKRWENSVQLRNGSDVVTAVPFFNLGFHHAVRRTQIGNAPNFFGWFKSGTYHYIGDYMKSAKRIETGSVADAS